MITRLGVATAYVTDYDQAREFFVDKIGFEVRHDLMLDTDYRWLTVGPPTSPEFQLVLTVPGPPKHDKETAAMLRSLIAKGALGVGAWHTDDCRKTFAEYSARGVEFISEPAERPYGVEAVFRDPFGNWYSLNEVNPAAFDAEVMKQAYPDG